MRFEIDWEHMSHFVRGYSTLCKVEEVNYRYLGHGFLIHEQHSGARRGEMALSRRREGFTFSDLFAGL